MEISKIGTNQNFLPFSESQFPIVLLEMVDRESHCAEMIFEQRLEKVSYAKMMGTGIPGWVAAVSAGMNLKGDVLLRVGRNHKLFQLF